MVASGETWVAGRSTAGTKKKGFGRVDWCGTGLERGGGSPAPPALLSGGDSIVTPWEGPASAGGGSRQTEQHITKLGRLDD